MRGLIGLSCKLCSWVTLRPPPLIRGVCSQITFSSLQDTFNQQIYHYCSRLTNSIKPVSLCRCSTVTLSGMHTPWILYWSLTLCNPLMAVDSLQSFSGLWLFVILYFSLLPYNPSLVVYSLPSFTGRWLLQYFLVDYFQSFTARWLFAIIFSDRWLFAIQSLTLCNSLLVVDSLQPFTGRWPFAIIYWSLTFCNPLLVVNSLQYFTGRCLFAILQLLAVLLPT